MYVADGELEGSFTKNSTSLTNVKFIAALTHKGINNYLYNLNNLINLIIRLRERQFRWLFIMETDGPLSVIDI